MSHIITFAVLHGDVKELTGSGHERIEFKVLDEEQGRVFGEYEYTYDPMFGSASCTNGEFIFDEQTSLFGITSESDVPKPSSIFHDIPEEFSVNLTAPKYPASASHEFYKTYGQGPYTVRFSKSLPTYELTDGHPYTVKPEDEAKEIAQHSRRQSGEELLREVEEDCIEDGMYVNGMDCVFEEDGERYRMSTPLRFSTSPHGDFTRYEYHLILDRLQELLFGNVKSVEEVLSEE